jgi:hypothetical protein
MDENPKRGRGRPRKDRHLGELRQLGAPPCADLLDLANWLHLAVAITARPDRGTAEMGAALRALGIALGKLLPAGLAAQAQGTINAGEIDPDGPPPVDDPLLRSVWLAQRQESATRYIDLAATLVDSGGASSLPASRLASFWHEPGL